jgi:hypothetical protein
MSAGNQMEQTGFPRRIFTAALLLLIEYVFTQLVTSRFLPDNLLQTGWSLWVLFWLISLLILPLCIVFLLFRTPWGWYLLVFYLTTQMLIRSVGLILELWHPTEVFHHPDSWGPTMNWGMLFLIKVLAWLFFAILFVVVWRSRERAVFFASGLGQQRAFWFSAGYAALVVGYGLL